MNKFSMGAVAGAASLLVAVPLLAQFAGAQSATSSSATGARVTPTQACVQAMADLASAHLDEFDNESSSRKAALEKKANALKAAAGIADDTEREAALKALHEDRQAPPTPSDAVTKAMDAVKTACGDTMMFRGGFGGPMMHGGMFHMKANIAGKLGMTEDELKAAIAGGKTIEQIAQEKGVTLPARPQGMHGMRFGWDKSQDATTDTDNQ